MPLKSIQHRLVLYVSLSLLIFAVLTGGVIYRYTFSHEIGEAIALEQQLVNTLQAQAEVAAFAANSKIAEGVLEGLRANPRIRSARISAENFNLAAGMVARESSDTTSDYPLFSPINGKDRVGVLSVVRNDSMIRAEATLSALRQTLLIVLQVLASAVLILLFSRQLIGKPVAALAQSLSAIKPGSGDRVNVDRVHEQDEIGALAHHINILIAEAENALAEVQAIAVTDALTGLPNRRAFMDRITNELERIRRYDLPPASVLMLDLDHFKAVNDTHGHAAGDLVLQRFGETIATELRKVDTAGRLGGEEFAILLPGTQPTDAAAIAERLRQRVQEIALPHDSKVLRFTVSIGISAMNALDQRPENALGRADQALYQAKHAGRNRVVVSNSPS